MSLSIRSAVPANISTVDGSVADDVIRDIMLQIGSNPNTDFSNVDFSNCDYTENGSKRILRLFNIDLIRDNIESVTFSGEAGRWYRPVDASDGMDNLISFICKKVYLKRLTLKNLEDSEIGHFSRLFMNDTITELCVESAGITQMGLHEINQLLSMQVNDRPCYDTLTSLCFDNLVDGDTDTAKVFADMLQYCSAIETLQFSNSNPGVEGSLAISERFSLLIIQAPNVKESLKSVNSQGSDFKKNESFGDLSTALDKLRNLEHVNLLDCNLTNSQNDKIRWMFGPKRKKTCETTYLVSPDKDDNDGSGGEAFPGGFDCSQRF